MNPLNYLKAIVGALVAGLGAAYMGLDDGTLTMQEWTMIAQTTLAAFATVWGIPNKAKEDKEPAEPQQVEIVQQHPVVVSQNTGQLTAVPVDDAVVVDLDGK